MQPLWSYQHVSAYVRGMRAAFALCKRGGRCCLRAGDSPLDLEGLRRDFAQAMDRRINLKAGIAFSGRNHDPDREIDLWRDSRDVRDILTKRLRVYRFRTDLARKRFGHLLASHDD